MPRIFKYGDIPNISFTSDKDLNILMYRSPSYLIIYRSHTLLKMVRFFWPTLYLSKCMSHFWISFPVMAIRGVARGQWSMPHPVFK